MAEQFAYCRVFYDQTGKIDDYEYLYVNKAFKRGTNLGNVVGKRITELAPDIKLKYPRLLEIYGRVSLTGKPEKFEIYIESFQKYFNASAFSTQRGYVASIFEDITDKKRIENELEHERQKWKSIIEGMVDEVWICDRNGLMSLMNVSASTLMGLEEFRNESVSQIYEKVDILTPDGKLRPQSRAPLLISLKDKVIRGEEIMRHRKTGVIRFREFNSAPIKDSDGRITGAVAIVRDITNSKLLEEKNKLFATIVETSHDAIIASSLDKTVTIWNRGAEKVYGFKPDEIIGKSLFAIVPVGFEKEIRQITSKIKKGKPVEHIETKRKRKDGSLIDILLTVSPIYNNRGEIIGSSSISKDITKIKKLERLKDEFLGVASHELKTPLASMKLINDLIKRTLKEKGDDQLGRLFFTIDKQINRLNRLVNDLLDVSRISEEKMELEKREFSIKKLIEEIVEYMQETTSHKIILNIPQDIKVVGDRNRIEQVFINMITNAVKYSPKADKVIIGLKHDKTEALAWVQDFGIGIAKSRQAKLFSKFYRVNTTQKERYPGLGLGLYISSEIIKKHTGKIWVDSEKGKGSTFYFTLPITSK